MELKRELGKAAFWSGVCKWFWGVLYAFAFLMCFFAVLTMILDMYLGKDVLKLNDEEMKFFYAGFILEAIYALFFYYIYSFFKNYTQECKQGIEYISRRQLEQILWRQGRIIKLYGWFMALPFLVVLFFLVVAIYMVVMKKLGG